MKRSTIKFVLMVSLLWGCLSAMAGESLVPVEERRGVEQTFLTFPEWYLVHSPAEYAAYVARNPAHGFPFIGHIKQLWTSYADVTGEQLRRGYPSNLGYHVMICVIAGSTAIEYSLRAIYENTLGRLSWALSPGVLTDEDKYAALVAQDYVNFIRKEPWYLYPFTDKLTALWTHVPMTGTGIVRKWERRYALTTEYLIKAWYAKLIEFATRQSYVPAKMSTYAVAVLGTKPLPAIPDVTVEKTFSDGQALLSMPRYYNFRLAATALAESGIHIVDIAGNQSDILVTAWVRSDAQPQSLGGRILFKQPMITMPGYERVALVLPVASLSDFLLNASHNHLTVEHVYDY